MDQGFFTDPTQPRPSRNSSFELRPVAITSSGPLLALPLITMTMRSAATVGPRLEVSFPIFDLPRPAVERYRRVPMVSLNLEIEFEDESQTEWFGPTAKTAPMPDRYLRARCWASEE